MSQVKEMAKAFAAAIPEKKLSPAELQGFLMNSKRRPAEAVAKAGDWADATLAAKKRDQ
jgi:chaperone BCS1